MLIVTAKSHSSDNYIFKFDGNASLEEIQARINNYAKELGDYDYVEGYSCIDVQDIYDIDDIPELLDYNPLYEDEEEECDY